MENRLPRHVAIIMDGNRRWAEKHGLSRIEGHKAGADNALKIVKYLDKIGVKYATLYSFSTENWNRPADEVRELMQMLEQYVEKESKRLDKLGFRIKHIGRTDRFSPKLQKAITDAVNKSCNNYGITVVFAFDYGGRTEIVQAAKNIIEQAVQPARSMKPLSAITCILPIFRM
jgi:undecaprenyl diphosphate synthase